MALKYQEYIITRGPSKLDLMLGLFDNSKEHPRTVEFSISSIPLTGNEDKERVSVFVDSVGVKNDIEESWDICGRCADDGRKVKIILSTRLRCGNFELVV